MMNQELLISRITQLSEDEMPSVLMWLLLCWRLKNLRQSLTALTAGLLLLSDMDINAINSVSSANPVYALLLRLPIQLWQISTIRCLPERDDHRYLHGNAIDYSAKRLGLYHQAAFGMRCKILLALQKIPETWCKRRDREVSCFLLYL